MKKYLIKGALALFAGGLLFSCAEKEAEYVPLAQQKVKAFEDVFTEIYGDVDPYQDWGFSQGKVEIDPNDSSVVVEVKDLDDDVAVTRTRAFGRAGTRTFVDANGNMWQDCPTVGPTEERDVVNYVEDLTSFNFSAPTGLTNYYVTHIHKGTDKYTAFIGGEPFKGSDHMDQLIIADRSPETITASTGTLDNAGSWQHVYDFNSGISRDYNGNMLMKDSGTKNFAYWNSIDGKWHDRWIAVNGSSIDPDKYGNYVYICFDYEGIPKDDGESFTVVSWKVPWNNPGETKELKMQIEGIWSLDQLYEENIVMVDNVNNATDQTYKVYQAGTSDWKIEQVSQGDKYTEGDNVYTDWIIRLVRANGSSIDYDYPVYAEKVWTQVEKGRVFCEDLGTASREDLDYNDVVFDAIIFNEHITKRMWQVRIVDRVRKDSVLCESAPGSTDKYPQESDLYYANVELLAAGGTIPITVAGCQVHDQFEPDVDIVTMINTRDNNSIVHGTYDYRDPAQLAKGEMKRFEIVDGDNTETFNLRLFEIQKPAEGNFIQSIKIVSSYDGQQVAELTGDKGGIPRKFMAPYGTMWTSERKNISLAYPLFGQWVKGFVTREACFSTASNRNDDYIYSGAVQPTGLRLPLVMKAKSTFIAGSEHDIWSGSKEYGESWNLENLETDPVTADFDKFYPGDRLRFYGTKIKDEAWITVVIGDIRPYFVDSEFPNYTLDSQGKKIPLPLEKTSCIEVMLDEDSAKLLNNEIKNGKLTFQVQGRNFTLTRICRVLFN